MGDNAIAGGTGAAPPNNLVGATMYVFSLQYLALELHMLALNEIPKRFRS